MKARRNVILVPIDFTPVTSCALDHAVQLANVLKFEICLLHIVGGDYYERRLALYTDKKKLDRLNEMAIKAKGDKDIKITAMVREGNIFDDIGGVAEEIGAFLIVMGTHGTVGLQKVFGSRALKVIANSDVPFVVTQKNTNKNINTGFKNIIVPINFTRESRQKLGWAIHMAKKFKSTIHLIAKHENDEFISKKIESNFTFAKKVLMENSVLYSVKLIKDKERHLSECTMDHAQFINADLIITETTPSKDLADFFIGPFEEKLINNGYQIPVMCVNPNKELYVATSVSGLLY